MNTIEYIAGFAFFIEFLGICLTYFELISTMNLLNANKKINGCHRHTIEHILLLLLLVVCNLSLIFWLITHKGIAHAWNIHIIEENFWIIILLFGILKITISKHLRAERKNII